MFNEMPYTPAWSAVNYQKINDGYCYNGSVSHQKIISKFVSNGLEDCAATCNATTLCRAFSYQDDSTNQCIMYTQPCSADATTANEYPWASYVLTVCMTL